MFTDPILEYAEGTVFTGFCMWGIPSEALNWAGGGGGTRAGALYGGKGTVVWPVQRGDSIQSSPPVQAPLTAGLKECSAIVGKPLAVMQEDCLV